MSQSTAANNYIVAEVSKFSEEGRRAGQNPFVTFKIVNTTTGRTARRGYRSARSAQRMADRLNEGVFTRK